MAIGRVRPGDSMGLNAGRVVERSWARTEPKLDSMVWSQAVPLEVPGVDQAVQGRPLLETLAEPIPSIRYETRVVARTEAGQIATLDFRDLIDKKACHGQGFLPWAVSAQEVSDYQKTAPPSGDRSILPKDHSLQVSSIEISLQSGPSQRYFTQLMQIGQVEDFHVVGLDGVGALATDRTYRRGGFQNFAVYQANSSYTWLEDASESLDGGARLVSREFSESSCWSREQIIIARQQRLGELAEVMDDSFLGMVNKSGAQALAAGQALLHGQPIRQAQTYLEGGNLLSGRRADGTPYVLVGEDTLALTRAILAKAQGEEPSPQEVKARVAADLGVEVGQLFAVEQPGTFHLDMRMMPIGPGRIALQDSHKAAALHLQWLREEGQMSESQLQKVAENLNRWAQQRAPLEELAARDLRAAGLQVDRVAGAFPEVSNLQRDGANFFNARHGVSPQGVRYSILMGAAPQAENYIAHTLLEELKAPIDRIYFLDPNQTRETLKLSGGFKCRTKLQGVLASLRAPLSLTPTPVDPGIQLALFDFS